MKCLRRVGLTLAICAVLWAPDARAQQELPTDAKELPLSRALAIDGVSQWSRRTINLDEVVARVCEGSLADPAAPLPKAGDTLPPPALLAKDNPNAGNPAWREVTASADSAFEGRPGTYLLARLTSAARRVMILEASGHAMVYVNAEPRMGDPYGTGYMKLPLLLRQGENTLLFAHAGRGPMRAKLVEPRASVMVLREDITTPDVLRGVGDAAYEIGVPVINASERTIHVAVGGSVAIEPDASRPEAPRADEMYSSIVTLPPCSVVKIPTGVPLHDGPKGDTLRVRLTVYDADDQMPKGAQSGLSDEPAPRVTPPADGVLASETIELRVVGEHDRRKETFTSEIDGSVQYYAVVPPKPEATPSDPAPGQPESRPLALVLSLHGASVEATSQAASYEPKTGMVIACPTNRRPFGFDWEDWGRVDAMEVLANASFAWNADPARVFLTGHSMGGHGTWQLGVHFPNRFAAIAPSAGWLSFRTYMGALGQKLDLPGESPFNAVIEAAARASDTPALMDRLRGRSIYILHGDADDNVPVSEARAARDILTKLGIPFESHEQPGAGHWWDDDQPGAACVDWPPVFEMFARARLEQTPDADPEPRLLDEHALPRHSFKRAFSNHFLMIYGTHGDAAENAQARAKARYDAEQWWYRGNGFACLMSDEVYLASARDGAAGLNNLILYGNADCNAAWSLVDPGAGVRVTRDRVSIGDAHWSGEDLGVLCVAPMKGHADKLIGIVAGSGLRGARAIERMPYFSAGTGFPDALVVRSSVWRAGTAGVVSAR